MNRKIKLTSVAILFSGLISSGLFAQNEVYKISLAEWSLHRSLELDLLQIWISPELPKGPMTLMR